MRSRLEADFARWLDDEEHNDWFIHDDDGLRWEYEPVCFAGLNDQYLPDFRIPDVDGLGDRYIEVKPLVALQVAGREWFHDPVEDFLAKMEVIWESEPQAELYLMAWEYKATKPQLVFQASGGIDRIWTVTVPGFPLHASLLWSGRRQWHDLCEFREAPVARGRR
jgi:hypothetical protein